MIEIRAHSKTDYAVLPDIDSSAMQALDDSDWDCLDEIGGLLIAEGANERFGVTLLHSHFPIDDKEIMVEEPQIEERAFTLRPVAGCAEDRVAINMQFAASGGDGVLSMIGLEYIRSEALSVAAPVSDSDAQALRGVREVLDRRNRLQRFGVGLLHDAIGLKESDVLLETCDSSARTLRCIAARRDDNRVRSSVETTWSWATPVDDAVSTDAQATRLCRRQCTVVKVCYQAEDGHRSQDGGHEPSGHETGPD